jgi:hypothetical protein
MARLADVERQLAEARRPAASVPPKPENAETAIPTSVDPQELAMDLPGVLKRLGIPADFAARQLLSVVAPDAMSPQARDTAATQNALVALRREIQSVRDENRALRTQVLRGEYTGQVREHISEIKPAEFPAVAAAMRNDPKFVASRVMQIAQEDARERVRRDPNATPPTPAEAVARLETELQNHARLLGATIGAPATQPVVAATTPAAPPKSVPAPAASLMSPAAPSTGTPPVSWEDFQEQVRQEMIRKYSTN